MPDSGCIRQCTAVHVAVALVLSLNVNDANSDIR
jgi:hypothetical protein